MSSRAPSRAQLRWETALGVLGLWSVAVPFMATALGMHLDVALRLEIADHVLPGILIAGAVAVLVLTRRAGHVSAWIAPMALGIAFLGGLWITATHVPLMLEAADGRPQAPWDASIFHSLWGPPITAIALWLLWRELAAAD